MSLQTFKVGDDDANRPLALFLSDRLRLTRQAVERFIHAGQVRVAGNVCLDPRAVLQPGQHVVVNLALTETPRQAPKPAAKGAIAQPVLVYVDAHIMVVNKPPGLTTMRHAHEKAEFGERGQRFLPKTLQDLLPELLSSQGKGRTTHVRAVHRLDKETSGLLVFALTPEAISNLGRQFRGHTTERLYRALVRGRPREGRIESWLVRDRGDGRRGSGPQSPDARRAITHLRLVESLGDYSFVECRLETGRTHQVRIHLGEAGAPLCGDHIYDRLPNGRPLPDESGARRVMLHAATLGFDHPATGERLRWEAPLPKDMAELLKRLRQQ